MNWLSYIRICKNLIHADLIIFRKTFLDKFIDLTIWVVLTIVVTAYIMPYFGLTADFGLFQFCGVIAAAGLFELYANVVDLVSDFEGDRVISYNLTLPIPSWLAIISKAAYYFIVYSILTILMLPIGKLCLWNQFDLTHIFYGKFLLAIIFQNAFYACLVLFVASIIASMQKFGMVWARFIFPMWFLGGFQFSWLAFYKAMPWFALINLINPMIYITEASRAAIIGQEGYINFWLCLLAMIVFAVLSLGVGVMNLKKRLDFV